MEQYISKSALIAEIETLISNGKFKCRQSQENRDLESYVAWSEHIATCGKILSYINTLEVKEFEDKPKFEDGDIIKHNRANIICKVICKVISVNSRSYYVENIKGGGRIKLFNAEQNFHLWTIRDANDGDVLCIHSSESDSDCVFLYKNTVEIESGRNAAVAYCGIDVYADRIDFGIQGPDCIDVRKIKPATKEQRDLLFTKMKEAGYKWNAKDKVLKEIGQTPTSYFYCKCVGTTPKCGDCVRNHLNSKYKTEDIKTWMTPTSRGTKQCSDYIPKDSVKWSEEDEEMFDAIIADILFTQKAHPHEVNQAVFERETDWLKSLKERMQ